MGMAIGAAAVEVLDGTERLRLCWVAAAVMAVVAHPRHAHLQQLRVVAAVRLVAVGAVFEYWRGLPQKKGAGVPVGGPALFFFGAFSEPAAGFGGVGVVGVGARA